MPVTGQNFCVLTLGLYSLPNGVRNLLLRRNNFNDFLPPLVFCSGWIWPGGGISRPRSLLTAFSHSCASEATSFGDIVSKATPPAQSSLLWHFSQRSWSIAHCGGAASSEPACGDVAAGADAAPWADAAACTDSADAAGAACPHSGAATATVAAASLRIRSLSLRRGSKRRPR